MGIKVLFDGKQVYSLSNGETAEISLPAKPGYLQFKMMGSSAAPHPIDEKVFFDPTACKQGYVDCQLHITPNWLGILTGGLFWTVGKLTINLNYF